MNTLTPAPVIKTPAVFDPEPLTSNPYLNIGVVSYISRKFYRNLEECQLGRLFRIVPLSISRQLTCIIRELSTSLVLRFSLFRHLSTPKKNLKVANPSSSLPDSPTSFLTILKVAGCPLILKPFRSRDYLSLCHHSRARPCLRPR